MAIVILSSAAANIFNKKFLTGTKVSIPQFALFAYVFALGGSFVIYLCENLWRYGNPIKIELLPLENLSKAEEVINVILFNSVNEIITYLMTLYLASKTYVARASVYGIVSNLFVIIEGLSSERFGPTYEVY